MKIGQFLSLDFFHNSRIFNNIENTRSSNMPRTADKTDLIRRAALALQEQTGIRAIPAPNIQAATDTRVTLEREGKTWDFHVEVKAWLNPQHIALLRHEKRDERTILVTHFVNPVQADELRALKIAYIDTAGNCFIDLPDLHLFVTGKKWGGRPAVPKWEFYRPAEIRVLFALLCVRGMEQETHKEIRQRTGVAIGTINRLLQTLTQEGFLVRLQKKARRLVRKKELIDRWVAAYPHGLRQKLLLATFTAPRRPLWETVDPAQFDAQWGGEVAAMFLTQYLKPQGITLYVDRLPTDLILQHGLRQQLHGEIEVLKRFWQFEGAEKTNIVPPLLVYADLIATHEERNAEAARFIYDQHVARFIRED